MSDIFDNLKKLKAFEELFLAFSNNKFILKDLNKPDEHFTMLFKNDGIVDVHHTKEGSEKRYESLKKYDLKKSIQKILAEPDTFVNAILEFTKIMKPVTFAEPEYSEYKIALVKTKEELASISKKEKKSVVIPKEALEELATLKGTIPWNKGKEVLKEYALVYDKNDVLVGCLFKKENTIFIPIKFFEESYLSKLFSLLEPEEVKDSNNDSKKS